ncbi:MAG: DNA gyrase subunit A [Candidatus Latescibacterota bacterium]
MPVRIEEELRTSFLDYSMSVIMARALPDVRDGLKPSQRRILVAMNDLGLAPNRGYRKCAKIAGDTSGNYHPHGEAIVYPTLVHMAQAFRMRYPLVDGQGNFGSIDGYPPAAMRYTEARLSWPAMEVLADLERDTVDFQPNYDETRTEPEVLPSKFPNLLCNGSMGIAVGFATKIPPHNLREVAAGLVALIDNPNISIDELMARIPAPDFPTGGVIYGVGGVRQAYHTGRGIVYVRARAEVETRRDGREVIVVTQIPFLVSKAGLLERIAELVRDRVIEGIANIRDESGRAGLRIVFELKREAHPDVVLNQLYSHSLLQSTFGVMMLAIVDGRPRLVNLKELLQHFVEHRHQVIVRRSRYDLAKAEARAHILAGLRIALEHIDEVIRTIRGSDTPEEARTRLMAGFKLSEAQAQAILAMPLQRLTGLEQTRIDEEYEQLLHTIDDLRGILASHQRQMQIIKDEIAETEERFGDDRRTGIVQAGNDFEIEDLIAEEDMVVTISHSGYTKRMPPRAYRVQGRGGRGVTGMRTKEEDFVEHLFVASTHSHLLFLTSSGRCYWLKVYQIPEGERAGRGRPIVNLLSLDPDDRIEAVVPVQGFSPDRYLFTATSWGVVKKTPLDAYQNVRRDGIIALKILDGDRLIGAAVTDGHQDIALLTRSGLAMRFHEDEVRPMGRVSTGVKGVDVRPGDEVVDMVVLDGQGTLLTICENGYGKRTPAAEYPCKHRGGLGVIDIRTTERNGQVVACKAVDEDDEVMIITQRGVVIRVPVESVSAVGRNTQGVRLIQLDEGDRVIDMARVARSEGELEAAEADGRDQDAGVGSSRAPATLDEANGYGSGESDESADEGETAGQEEEADDSAL